jgi:hypothetical protein
MNACQCFAVAGPFYLQETLLSMVASESILSHKRRTFPLRSFLGSIAQLCQYEYQLCNIVPMNMSFFRNNVRKLSALVAACLIIPAVAYAGSDNGNGNGGQNNGNQNGKNKVPAVPEVNTTFVLIPVLGAVLLFSSVQALRKRSGETN